MCQLSYFPLPHTAWFISHCHRLHGLSPTATHCMVYLPLPQTAWFISHCMVYLPLPRTAWFISHYHTLHGLSPTATHCMVYLPLPHTAWFISHCHRLHGAVGEGGGLAHLGTVILDTWSRCQVRVVQGDLNTLT